MENKFYQNEDYKNKTLCGNLLADLSFFKGVFKNDSVFRTRIITLGKSGIKAALMFMDGMSDSNAVASDIVRAIFTADIEQKTVPDIRYLCENVLYSGEIKENENIADMLRGIMYGDTVIIVDGQKSALIVNTKGFRTRGISEPPDEKVQQGPREGFDETALLNVALIRRKLLTPDFCCEMLRIGRRTDTLCFICYLDSLVDKKILAELKKRLERIDIDGILDTNYIAESIRDRNLSVFKTTGATERPDVVSSKLLEGRIAVITDGSPVVLTLPYLFSENFQSDEDYYLNFFVGSLGRILRIISFIISCFAAPAFVALSCFHAGLLPTSFALSVIRLRTAVPLSTVGECLMLILAFEILKEAGARARQNTGQALSIVGGLVVGQAAVEAQIVSAPMLIVVALSGICAVAVPKLQAAVFYIRIISVIACAFAGFLGLFAVCSVTLLYILNLESFGVGYTVSLSSPYLSELKDTFIRISWRKMIKRPLFNKNKIRQERK